MKRNEQVRKELLLQLYGARPVVLSPELIQKEARGAGFNFTSTEITRELQFLVDEGLVKEHRFAGNTVKLYRLLSEGVRIYEELYIA